uniref:Integrase catalytic domain-containing protein n=1 Tax=Phytophthora ramorum TaxID=164328 RepID=H3H9I0_PHYRM
GGLVIQRNWTVDRPVAKRNECLHLDYLYLGESYGDTKYVLVLKDELTHFCELVPADVADSQTAVAAILDWNKRFGAPPTWMSDNGSHFKSEVVGLLAERLGASHQFAPVYTPWINGTVERVNRDILQVLRVMLLESRLDTRNWVYLLPIIQANLNHTPVYSLGNCAPVELFTGLPAVSALDIVATPTERVLRNLPMEKAALREAVEELRRSLHGLHRVVRDRREQQRHQGPPALVPHPPFTHWG